MSAASRPGATTLVTGANGFMGSWLTDRLLSREATVVVPLRNVAEGSHFERIGLSERCELPRSTCSTRSPRSGS